MNPNWIDEDVMNPTENPGGRPFRSGALFCSLLALLSLTFSSPVQAQGAGGAGQPGAQPMPSGAPGAAAEPAVPLWTWDPNDPRVGKVRDSEPSAWNVELMANAPRPEGFATNTDLAFKGDLLILGNYNGFNVYDVSNPRSPSLVVSVLCPGSQGDVSIYGNLLFKSVESGRGRLDCGTEPPEGDVSPDRFRGVRIFDISDIRNPRQVAAVQTCRGSHTHSLVTNPRDTENIYVYVSGTSSVRSAEELPGCSGEAEDPNTSLFQIEVIQVPLSRPQDARIVNAPRVFADPLTGAPAGLRAVDRDGIPSSPVRACHDITTYPAIGLAGGACSGNGILLDISDPVNPVRLTEVADPNFAYWHSATFNNDGTKVVFTDEWGGGGAPRCRAIDPPNWGGNAIFDLVNGRELRHRSYYKLPVPKEETCVAHNGSLIPVPGRDIYVQAWYQGGISIFDFTDAGAPKEIAFFDRGPGGGYWSAYWHNGHIYGSGMGRGLDILRLTPSEFLSENEIAAAMAVRFEDFNPQHQPKFEWPADFTVARAYVDQLERERALDAGFVTRIRNDLNETEQRTGNQRRSAAQRLVGIAGELEAQALEALTRGQTGNATRIRALLASTLKTLAEGVQ